ncbi:hypothetical protein [Thalassobacillus hwangdonensis]|uniref:Uncharacterized protein n=1 Tax=Thalassobacillus hwangdonensis TaxID=546108 RepID=A0ABW3KXY0_9BACI
MKQLFQNREDDRGFIFPFVLLLSLLLIGVTTVSISMYSNSQLFNNIHKEELSLQSIFQTAVETYKEDDAASIHETEVTYTFPHGTAVITLMNHTENSDLLQFQLTNSNEFTKTVIKELPRKMQNSN